jgi:hypothetical protein
LPVSSSPSSSSSSSSETSLNIPAPLLSSSSQMDGASEVSGEADGTGDGGKMETPIPLSLSHSSANLLELLPPSPQSAELLSLPIVPSDRGRKKEQGDNNDGREVGDGKSGQSSNISAEESIHDHVHSPSSSQPPSVLPKASLPATQPSLTPTHVLTLTFHTYMASPSPKVRQYYSDQPQSMCGSM